MVVAPLSPKRDLKVPFKAGWEAGFEAGLESDEADGVAELRADLDPVLFRLRWALEQPEQWPAGAALELVAEMESLLWPAGRPIEVAG